VFCLTHTSDTDSLVQRTLHASCVLIILFLPYYIEVCLYSSLPITGFTVGPTLISATATSMVRGRKREQPCTHTDDVLAPHEAGTNCMGIDVPLSYPGPIVPVPRRCSVLLKMFCSVTVTSFTDSQNVIYQWLLCVCTMLHHLRYIMGLYTLTTRDHTNLNVYCSPTGDVCVLLSFIV